LAVVAGVAHRRGQDAVDEDRAAFLVHFVLDWLGVLGNLDDDVDLVGGILAGGDVVQTHALQLRRGAGRKPAEQERHSTRLMLHCGKTGCARPAAAPTAPRRACVWTRDGGVVSALPGLAGTEQARGAADGVSGPAWAADRSSARADPRRERTR